MGGRRTGGGKSDRRKGERYTGSVKKEVGEVCHLITRQTIFFLTPKADNRYFILKK